MSLLQARGGIPHVLRVAVDQATGRKHRLPHYSSFLVIRVHGAACRLYSNEQDFDANANYVLVPVPSPATPNGEWAGPVEAGGLWFRKDESEI
jgi:hypothetical protein